MTNARHTSKKVNEAGVNVLDFLDYRAFLRSYYEAAKRSRGGFSFRMFSQRAGLRSPNFFKLVMDGDRNLGADTIPKFADALGLEGYERDFFSDLVAFAQATDHVEKNRAFERLASSRRFRMARRIDNLVLSYLSHWYNPAIRELAARPDFQEDPKWIALQLRPEITVAQAADSLALLSQLGLLERDSATGLLRRGEPTLTTEHEVSVLGVGNFHRQMLERAAEAIEGVAAEERDFSALTVCISAETAQEVKRRVHRFRESMMELCDAHPSGEIVYQLNLQWFPLSRLATKGTP